MNENSWFKKIKISFDLYCLKIKFSLLNKLWRAEKDSLVVQWLGLQASIAGGMGLISGQWTKILHIVQCGKKKKIKTLRFHKAVGKGWL